MELLKDFEEQLIKIEKRLNPEYTHTGECPQCTELAETIYAIVEEVKSKTTEEVIDEVGKIFIQYLDNTNSPKIREFFEDLEEETFTDKIQKLQADKTELLEALESTKPILRYFPEKLNEIESLIQKHTATNPV